MADNGLRHFLRRKKDGKHQPSRLLRPAMSVLAIVILVLLALGGSVQQAHALFSFCCPSCPCIEPGITVIAKDYSAAKTAQKTSLLGEWATQFTQWAKQFELLSETITVLISFQGVLNKAAELVKDRMDILIATQHAEKTLRGKLKEKEYEESQNTQLESEKATLEAGITSKTEPRDSDAVLCNTIAARQGQAIMQQYADACGQEVTDAIMDAFRGAGADGTGPQRAGVEYLLRCPPASQDAYADYPKTMSHLDEASADCVEAGYEDSDTVAKILSGEDVVLEMPPLVEHTVKDTNGNPVKGADGKEIKFKIPTPNHKLLEDTDDESMNERNLESYEAQRRWVAAFHYCFYAAGPRPSPPAASAMKTPDGIVAMSQWDQCAAAQSSFIRQCAQMMCNNTRPNGTDTYTDEIRTATMTACDAAVANGTAVPGGSCNKPLTRYEAEYVSRMSCFGTDRSVMGGTGAGTGTPEVILQNDQCMVTYGRWQEQKKKEINNFVKGMEAMQKLKGCWPNINLRPALKSS